MAKSLLGTFQRLSSQQQQHASHQHHHHQHQHHRSQQPVALPGMGIIYRDLHRIDDQPSNLFDPKLTIEELLSTGYTHINATQLPRKNVVISDQKIFPPQLQHGLDKVVTQYGLHPLKTEDKYNFSPFLARCPQPNEIDHTSFPPFVTSSKDETLHSMALKVGARFKGSTSSVTGFMSHCYYLLSRHKHVRLGHVKTFKEHPSNFTPAAVKPVSLFLRCREGTYSIDRDAGSRPSENRILMDMGKILEHLLTSSQDEFEQRFLLSKRNQGAPKFSHKNANDAYNYLLVGDKLLLRSQLDCYHPEVGIFDIKTRATFAIRINASEWEEHTNYRLEQIVGATRSYEREYYDMIRAAFLKYIFQCRIGSMAGVFVAYHNTQEMFGFEFVSLKEMEYAVFHSQKMADLAFDVSCRLLSELCDRLTTRFPGETLRITLQAESRDDDSAMTVFVERIPSTQKLVHTDGAAISEVVREDIRRQALETLNPIHKYVVRLYTSLNDRITMGRLTLRDYDDPKVFVRIREDTESPKSKIMEEYMQMVRDSSLHVMPDELEKMGLGEDQASGIMPDPKYHGRSRKHHHRRR